jgi:hypothetical protein
VSTIDACVIQVNEIVYDEQESAGNWQGSVCTMCHVGSTEEVWMGTTAGHLYVFRVRDVWEDKGALKPSQSAAAHPSLACTRH